ncbi:hypothetical protein SAMN05444166_4075 [Singulisphaera sp. GP187]|nr:hypothetical protein SAMN05444166_4075 [Singulisphaera sp. GP187]
MSGRGVLRTDLTEPRTQCSGVSDRVALGMLGRQSCDGLLRCAACAARFKRRSSAELDQTLFLKQSLTLALFDLGRRQIARILKASAPEAWERGGIVGDRGDKTVARWIGKRGTPDFGAGNYCYSF